MQNASSSLVVKIDMNGTRVSSQKFPRHFLIYNWNGICSWLWMTEHDTSSSDRPNYVKRSSLPKFVMRQNHSLIVSFLPSKRICLSLSNASYFLSSSSSFLSDFKACSVRWMSVRLYSISLSTLDSAIAGAVSLSAITAAISYPKQVSSSKFPRHRIGSRKFPWRRTTSHRCCWCGKIILDMEVCERVYCNEYSHQNQLSCIAISLTCGRGEHEAKRGDSHVMSHQSSMADLKSTVGLALYSSALNLLKLMLWPNDPIYIL